jgi:hypothetical protein
MSQTGERLIPVDRDTGRSASGLADTTLGFAAQPLERALVVADVRLELLEAASVVLL